MFVAAPGETSVEVVLPEGGSSLQLSCSGWSWVVGVDAVGGPPHGDFTDDGEARGLPGGAHTGWASSWPACLRT